MNQYHDQHLEIPDTACFSASGLGWGHSSVLPLTDLHDASKGFLVNDNLTIKAEVSAISTVKNFQRSGLQETDFGML
ncbi:hypothetical protein Vadar_024675 [Vaccinium darrowii]|uniref:Uncharacterized protein n=1 Tax=Vaccinium darrowii TaxID=229202 RepID=A0ACB7X3P3_9ERIC|nr:hypothetical protein Vadar_024675 [Vaccinium darrowii]